MRDLFPNICTFLCLNDVELVIYLVSRVLGLVCGVLFLPFAVFVFERCLAFDLSSRGCLVWFGGFVSRTVYPYSSRGRSREASLLLSSNMVESWHARAFLFRASSPLPSPSRPFPSPFLPASSTRLEALSDAYAVEGWSELGELEAEAAERAAETPRARRPRSPPRARRRRRTRPRARARTRPRAWRWRPITPSTCSACTEWS